MEDKIFEIKTDNLYIDELIKCLLNDGYILHLTPCHYKDGADTVMVEVDEKDASFVGWA